MVLRLRSTCALMVVVWALVVGSASVAAADSISVEWDPTSSLVGYKVHVGTVSGSYTQHFDVGSNTLFVLPTATAGQRYCFAVSAYLLTSLLEGPSSTEVCGYSNAPPTLVNPGTRTSSTGEAVTLQLVGSDPASEPLTYSATGLPPGLTLMASTGFISGAGTTAGTYSVTVGASDNVLTASQTFTWVITAAAGDTTLPTAAIATPTTGTTYSTTASTIAFSGTASDNVGVTQIRWATDRGHNGFATGTTNWSVPGLPLLSGINVITVTAFDAAGNQGTDTLTVTYTAPTADTTKPTISIATPTTGTTYATSVSSLNLGGTAADNVAVSQVRWASDRGASGIATGTTNWSVSGIPLSSGTNVITVTAFDAAGNQGTSPLTVAYTVPPPSSVTLTGSSSGALTAQLSWTTNPWPTVDVYRNGNMVAHTYNDGTHADIVPSSGTYSYRICSHDSTTVCSNSITVTVTDTVTPPPDTTRPTVSISTPTTGTSYATSVSSLNLGGAAADNVAVSQVRWASDRGASGVATGTTNWSVSGIPLSSGSNVITVTAFDAAGNQGASPLTVTYTAPAAGDTTRPTVSISSPTTGSSYSTAASSINLGGSAADNVGVTQVRWATDRGHNGWASGTTGWSVAVPLLSGTNVITVTALDAAGNAGTASLTVTFAAAAPPADTTRPTISISTPTSGTSYSTAGSSVNLAGIAADNVGVTQVRWATDRGQSGVASGTTGWSVNVPLLSGSNVVTVTALDAAGNAGTAALTVTVTVNTPPPTPVTLRVEPKKGNRWRSAKLTWSNAPWSSVDVYRNGMMITNTGNTGYYTDPVWGRGTYTYKVCAPGSTTNCSNTATVYF